MGLRASTQKHLRGMILGELPPPQNLTVSLSLCPLFLFFFIISNVQNILAFLVYSISKGSPGLALGHMALALHMEIG